jgi:hypothetical protein
MIIVTGAVRRRRRVSPAGNHHMRYDSPMSAGAFSGSKVSSMFDRSSACSSSFLRISSIRLRVASQHFLLFRTDDRPVRDTLLSRVGQFRQERLQGRPCCFWRPLQPLSSLATAQTTRQTSSGDSAQSSATSRSSISICCLRAAARRSVDPRTRARHCALSGRGG